ncbi:MAG TPA: MFS transporter [Acidimicrobiales bacterium]|nr:MFS transporter [Acidimicrobiales bacterium]
MTAPRVYRWNDRAVLGAVIASLASGVAQFGVVAALGSVARTFGHLSHGATIADQAGLSGTKLGAGLAIIRLASLGGLPLAALADRLGRRRALLVTVAIGLALTALAAASPGYWWFVVIFACGRPLLSATNALAEVIAAEQTDSSGRAKALALVSAGYGLGAGFTAVIHSLTTHTLGFRGLFLLTAVPLVLLPLIARWTQEPDRFAVARASRVRSRFILGAVEHRFRAHLLLLVSIAFALSFITGPANSLIFLDAQNVVHLSGVVTAAMVVGAGATGLAGLLVGRWMADHVGRRLTGAIGMVGLGLSGVLAYAGSKPALVAGYVLGVMFGSLFAPAGGAIINELFPTTVRATAAGWFLAAGVLGAVSGLLAFGAIADVGNRFAIAADITFLPAIAVAALFWFLPETRGRELTDT